MTPLDLSFITSTILVLSLAFIINLWYNNKIKEVECQMQN